jgi:hypothetical protein
VRYLCVEHNRLGGGIAVAFLLEVSNRDVMCKFKKMGRDREVCGRYPAGAAEGESIMGVWSLDFSH